MYICYKRKKVEIRKMRKIVQVIFLISLQILFANYNFDVFAFRKFALPNSCHAILNASTNIEKNNVFKN